MTFLRTLITFSLGIYAGIYTTQNYETPKVQSPVELYERAKECLKLQNKTNE
ncbi:hypothetical protein I4U23_025261 [Adineta vaga]|nr:hypothetical protein I4U23_025261 [Adineta vaga]